MKLKPVNLQFFRNLFVFILLLLIGTVLFSDHFRYGLASDENRVLLLLKSSFAIVNINSFLNLIPYGGSPVVMLVDNILFGYTPMYYYITSMILRVVASFSIYLLGKSLFKNKFVGIAASLLFIASFAGVESSAPANMGTYLSIAFMNFGFIDLFNYLQDKSKKMFNKTLFHSYIWFALAIVFNAVRMHGLIFIFLATEIFALLLKLNRLKNFIFQIFLFVVIVLVIKHFGFLGTAGTSAGVANSLLDINYLLKIPNPIRTIFYMLVSFYQMLFVPEANPLHPIFIKAFSNLHLTNPLTFILLFSPSFAVSYISIVLLRSKKVISIIPSIIWLVFIFMLSIIFPSSLFGKAGEGVSMLVAGALVIFIFRIYLLLSQENKHLALKLLFLLIWPFCFILIPHLAWPDMTNYTVSRYFTVSVVGICLLVSYLVISGGELLIKNKYLRFVVLGGIILTIFIINFRLTEKHFQVDGMRGLYKIYIDNTYQVMNDEIGDRTDKVRPIVYLDSDNSDFADLSIVDGGQERFSLLHDDMSENIRPFFVSTYDDLIATFCHDKYNLHTTINDIFAFKIANKKIYVESKNIREDLLKLARDNKNCPGYRPTNLTQ